MNLKALEDEILHLSKKDRSELLQKLVLSLDAPNEAELREEWLHEAQRRASELDAGMVREVPGKEVMRKARSLVK